MHRHVGFGAVAIAVLALSSGCLGVITGETVAFESTGASVSQGTLDETGYELRGTESQNVTRDFSVAGQERTVEVTNHVARYDRNVSVGPLGERSLARFVVLSTPAVELAGQTFNPVAGWSERRIVGELSSEYEGLSDVSHVDNRSVETLGDRRTVATFTGRATAVEGMEIDVVLHVTKFRHGDDFVLAVGIHPEQLSGERDRVDGMFRGLSH